MPHKRVRRFSVMERDTNVETEAPQYADPRGQTPRPPSPYPNPPPTPQHLRHATLHPILYLPKHVCMTTAERAVFFPPPPPKKRKKEKITRRTQNPKKKNKERNTHLKEARNLRVVGVLTLVVIAEACVFPEGLLNQSVDVTVLVIVLVVDHQTEEVTFLSPLAVFLRHPG